MIIKRLDNMQKWNKCWAESLYMFCTLYIFSLPASSYKLGNVGITFLIISLNRVPGMKGLNLDLLELIVLIQDYDGCRKRPLCPG